MIMPMVIAIKTMNNSLATPNFKNWPRSETLQHTIKYKILIEFVLLSLDLWPLLLTWFNFNPSMDK